MSLLPYEVIEHICNYLQPTEKLLIYNAIPEIFGHYNYTYEQVVEKDKQWYVKLLVNNFKYMKKLYKYPVVQCNILYYLNEYIGMGGYNLIADIIEKKVSHGFEISKKYRKVRVKIYKGFFGTSYTISFTEHGVSHNDLYPSVIQIRPRSFSNYKDFQAGCGDPLAVCYFAWYQKNIFVCSYDYSVAPDNNYFVNTFIVSKSLPINEILQSMMPTNMPCKSEYGYYNENYVFYIDGPLLINRNQLSKFW